MMKMRWMPILSLLLFFCFLFMAMPAAAAETEKKACPYEEEIQLHQFRGHGGDRYELTETLQALFNDLKDGQDGLGYIAEGVVDAEPILAYFEKLKALDELGDLSVKTELFYKVKDKAVHMDYRAIAAFSYFVQGENGEKFMHTDRLAMAKLGPEEKDWKIWKVLHISSPLDVADVELKQLEAPTAGEEICIIETDAGEIRCRLFPEATPRAVENFKGLAEKEFYNGKLFHRCIDEFVIQGGAENESEEEGLSFFGEPFEDEFSAGLYHFRGALALANSGPNTNGNQFYIVQNSKVRDTDLDLTSLPLNVEEKYRELGGLPHLDFRYTIFGQVYEGMDIVDQIAKQETDEEDRPVKDPISIISIRFEKAE